MLLVYGVNRNAIKCRVRHDHYHDEESYGEILKLIILIVSPIILSSFIYNINGYLNGVLYSEIMGKHGVNADMISMMYAEYATYFMSIINIPLTLSSAAPTSMIPEVSALYATGDIDETRRRVDQTVQLSMFISIWRNKWCGRKAFDAWILYDTSEWNVQHFQWSTSGNW